MFWEARLRVAPKPYTPGHEAKKVQMLLRKFDKSTTYSGYTSCSIRFSFAKTENNGIILTSDGQERRDWFVVFQYKDGKNTQTSSQRISYSASRPNEEVHTWGYLMEHLNRVSFPEKFGVILGDELERQMRFNTQTTLHLLKLFNEVEANELSAKFDKLKLKETVNLGSIKKIKPRSL